MWDKTNILLAELEKEVAENPVEGLINADLELEKRRCMSGRGISKVIFCSLYYPSHFPGFDSFQV
jgi:hypothetical protein